MKRFKTNFQPDFYDQIKRKQDRFRQTRKTVQDISPLVIPLGGKLESIKESGSEYSERSTINNLEQIKAHLNEVINDPLVELRNKIKFENLVVKERTDRLKRLQRASVCDPNLSFLIHGEDSYLREEVVKFYKDFGKQTVEYLKKKNLSNIHAIDEADSAQDVSSPKREKNKQFNEVLEKYNPDNEMLKYELNKKKKQKMIEDGIY